MRLAKLMVAAGVVAVMGMGHSVLAQTITIDGDPTTYSSVADAIAAATDNDVILIDGGIVAENISINKPNLTLRGVNGGGLEAPDTSTNSVVVSILRDNVTVEDLQVHVNQPYAGLGIWAKQQSTAANRLQTVNILGNTVYTTRRNNTDGATAGTGNANVPLLFHPTDAAVGIAVLPINPSANDAFSYTVNIVDNIVGRPDDSQSPEHVVFSNAGIWVEGQKGLVEGNEAYAESFALITRFVRDGVITVANNYLWGWGDEDNRGSLVELGDPGANSAIFLLDNEIVGQPGTSPITGRLTQRAVQIKNGYTSDRIVINGNTITAPRTGVAATNSRGAVIERNSITAADDNALLIEVNNKIYSGGASNQPAGYNRVTVAGNELNDGGFNGVTGIAFRQHQNAEGGFAGNNIAFSRNIVGGPGRSANRFAEGLEWSIFLDDSEGPSINNPAYFRPSNPGVAHLANTYMKPFEYHVYAVNNEWEVNGVFKLPTEMDSAEHDLVAATIQDYQANDELGFVIWDLREDADGDGLPDEFEEDIFGTDPNLADSQDDGFTDLERFLFEVDPTIELVDSDGDRLPETNNVITGQPVDPTPGTPRLDTDGDGFADWFEILNGYDPNFAGSRPTLGDVNGDGVIDLGDALDMFRFILGLPTDNPVDVRNFDVNQDGQNDNIDAVLIINLILGNINVLPFDPDFEALFD